MDAFAGLAEHLRTRRSAIVERCRHAAESASPTLTSATFSPDELCEYIPATLEAFEHHLAPPSTAAAEATFTPIAAALGDQRWRQNRSIGDVVREVTLLETVVLEELDAFEQQHPDLLPGVMTAARKRLAQFSGSFTALTVTEYANARHAAAASQINRLELDLNRSAERERERALSWRKAAHDLRGSLSVIGNASSVLVLPNVPEQMRVECGAILERGVDTLRTRLEACIDQAQQGTAT